MSKVTQIPCIMTNEEINEFKIFCKAEKTKDLFTNRYKTSPIAMGQMLLEDLAKIRNQKVSKI